jgi:hypothetical protein
MLVLQKFILAAIYAIIVMNEQRFIAGYDLELQSIS